MHNVLLRYYEWSAFAHRRSADFVAYTSDPAEAKVLLSSGEHYRDFYGGAYYCPRAWDRMGKEWYGSGLFLHERRNSSGERLIAVGIIGFLRYDQPGPGALRTYLIKPRIFESASSPRRFSLSATLKTVPREDHLSWPAFSLVDSPTYGNALTVPRNSVVRFYAGQPDATDLRHFTIRYEIDGATGAIDGWLLDDDSVKLDVRDGPLKSSGGK